MRPLSRPSIIPSALPSRRGACRTRRRWPANPGFPDAFRPAGQSDHFRVLTPDWRLRLKRDLLVFEAGGETTLAECLARGEPLLSGIELTGKRVVTHIALVHEPGHPEPWIVALSAAPTVHRAFDYGLRWGSEAMFSDFKSRGFGLEDSQIRHPDRLARLLLVMALALHWAVSTGLWATAHQPLPAEKKPRRQGRRSWPAAEPRSSRAAYAASNASFNS